jgi:hypothetical protein
MFPPHQVGLYFFEDAEDGIPLCFLHFAGPGLPSATVQVFFNGRLGAAFGAAASLVGAF